MGLVLVFDAVPGAKMEQVVFTDDRGLTIYDPSSVSRRNRAIMALSGSHVPLTIRAVWRKGAGWDDVRKVWNEGVVAGDYTIPFASRIPDAVLRDIRAHRGNLRLKFRLKPDGILFGWDIERAAPPWAMFRFSRCLAVTSWRRATDIRARERDWHHHSPPVRRSRRRFIPAQRASGAKSRIRLTSPASSFFNIDTTRSTI